MTQREAQAILACQTAVREAVNRCLRKLSPRSREYAEAYWAAHLLSTANGTAYGGLPIQEAERTLFEGEVL